MARIGVRIIPGGARNVIEGWSSDELRVRVMARPIEGAANGALLRLLAKALDVPPSHLAITRGVLHRSKVVEVAGLSDEQVRTRLSAIGIE